MLGRNPVVHHSVVMRLNPRRSDRVLKNSRAMIAWHNVARHVAIHEMARVNESEMTRAQPKRKILPRRMTIERQADAGNKSRARRQRRPAAIITPLPPGNPRPPPNTIITPAPA